MTNTKSSSDMQTGYAARRKAINTLVYVILAIMVVIWIFPIVWLVIQSLRARYRNPPTASALTADNTATRPMMPAWAMSMVTDNMRSS